MFESIEDMINECLNELRIALIMAKDNRQRQEWLCRMIDALYFYCMWINKWLKWLKLSKILNDFIIRMKQTE